MKAHKARLYMDETKRKSMTSAIGFTREEISA
jgi:hypothetical protein